MIEFAQAFSIAKAQAVPLTIDKIHFGEIPGKYVFFPQDSNGKIPPGGGAITVDKKTGECKYEYLERENNKLWSPFKNYRSLSFNDVVIR